MTAINFPDSPSVNDTFTASGRTWTWNGTVWVSLAADFVDQLAEKAPLDSPTFTGVADFTSATVTGIAGETTSPFLLMGA